MINISKSDSSCKEHTDFLKKKLAGRVKTVIKDNSRYLALNNQSKTCLEYIQNNLENIISADVEELKKIIKYFNKHFIFIRYINKKVIPNIYQLIYNIFVDNGYDDYLSKIYDTKQKNNEKFKIEKGYHAYKLVKNLDIKSCPYCNRSFISYVKNTVKETVKKTRPQLDHFYPKSIYPFLACSFYNLIPSCSACNHMKGDDDSYIDEVEEKLINPYNVSDNDFRFSYTLNDLKITEITAKKDIKFDYEDSIEILLETKYKKNNEYFQLEEIYKNHKDIVVELILKEMNYPKSYIEELIENDFGTEEEIYRFLFSNYLDIDDLHKRPLSKLTRDICEELGILDKIQLSLTENTK